MTAAARELSYSHSAISQQLAQLEHETGVVLLERVGRGVQLTAAGEELVRNTHAIMAAVERAESDLATSHRHPRGILRVAAFATISRTV
ncbi:LysR family transcriptional regulator, partial [Allochromatium vinosum]|nr:LysR family transcriptional regulator [Allochromatium vinosum]